VNISGKLVSKSGSIRVSPRHQSGIGIRTGYFFAKHDRFYLGVPAKGMETAQAWTFEAED